MSDSDHYSLVLVETFHWISEDEKTEITFPVTRMIIDIINSKLPASAVETPIEAEFAEKWLPKRDLDYDRIANMSSKILDIPVLMAEMPDGTALLIDGSHRYTARYRRGKPTIKVALVSLKDWLPYAKIIGPWPPTPIKVEGKAEGEEKT